MSNSYESIPPAVAAIVSSTLQRLLMSSEPERVDTIKRVVDLTDQLTRTFVKALAEAHKQAGKP